MSPISSAKASSRPPREQPPALTVLHPNAAGIDVHSNMHMVCVPAASVATTMVEPGGLPPHVRRFGANSCDLHAIADWLQSCGVITVAMESTGVYWIPLFELLEAAASRSGWSNRANSHAVAPARRPMRSTPSGFNACTAMVCCDRRSGRPIRSWRCGAITASGRCSSAMPPAMCCTCRKPWNR